VNAKERLAIIAALKLIRDSLDGDHIAVSSSIGESSFFDVANAAANFWYYQNSYSCSILHKTIDQFIAVAEDPHPSDPSDISYANASLNSNCRIYLDGVVCNYCVEANAEEGWVNVLSFNPDNTVVVDDNREPIKTTLRGSVTIRRPETKVLA